MAMKVVRQARLELSGGSTPDLLRPTADPPPPTHTPAEHPQTAPPPPSVVRLGLIAVKQTRPIVPPPPPRGLL